MLSEYWVNIEVNLMNIEATIASPFLCRYNAVAAGVVVGGGDGVITDTWAVT